MALTKNQQKVQDIRDKNMLVSAAAGSGKTFVLVKRILSKIIDDGVDVDRILVVTFTNAAAAEMKERIRVAITKALSEGKVSSFLRKQATLVHNAQIKTIDSFCLWLVQNYFYEIDQDPSFRIDSKGQLKVIADEILSDLISEKLKEGQEDFMLLADAYIVNGKLNNLKDMVQQLYRKAMSFPWVDAWYDSLFELYSVKDAGQLENTAIVGDICDYLDQVLNYHINNLNACIGLYGEINCDNKDILKQELDCYRAALEAKGYSAKRLIMTNINYVTWSRKKVDLDKATKDYIKNKRSEAKSDIQNLNKIFLAPDLDQFFDAVKLVETQIRALVELTREYGRRFFEEKKKKGIFDFNDIEHMALNILRNPDSKEHEKRPVALELSAYFSEVMVDEYQDSNELQEAILTAVSRDNNYFTVGDVKQSIYAFREASPDLFKDKLANYSLDEKDGSPSVRVDLDTNFRSRAQVLDFCNDIFTALMQEDIGEVAYDEAACLKVGAADFPEKDSDFDPEIYIFDANKDAMKEVGLSSEYAGEAGIVALRIEEMIRDGFQVTARDSEGKAYLRPAKYSDMVILLRGTANGKTTTYIDALKAKGIKAYVAEEKGFFDRDEIKDVLAMLSVIDNPYNDIPLATVLSSKLFGLSDEKLALIKASYPDESFWGSVFLYGQDNPEDEQVAYFIKLLEYFRNEALDRPIHEMIGLILDKTGYDTLVGSYPMGNEGIANLNKLIDEAVSFESNSFKGLSSFVRYINNLKTYDQELGLAKDSGENDNAVRIMTIHKSKGLEFPIVFLCNTGSSLYNSGKGDLFYSAAVGLGMNYKNPSLRIKYDFPFASYIKKCMKQDSLGEEMRILYVALTRAKEKLIITGSIAPNDKESVADKVEAYKGAAGSLDFMTKFRSKSFLEWIIRSLNAAGRDKCWTIKQCQDLVINEVEHVVDKEAARREIISFLDQADETAAAFVAHRLAISYEGENTGKYRAKYSVSELKHLAIEENYADAEDAAPSFTQEEHRPYVPLFARKKAGAYLEASNKNHIPAGALYGTAMHRFMECYDFVRDDYDTSFEDQLSYITSSGLMSAEDIALISRQRLSGFMASPLAKRMHLAAVNGALYKEQPFVFSSTVDKLFSDEQAQESVLIQGIIDVFFEEDDGIVLLDYKTDKVDEAAELVVRYERQLELYKDAIYRAYHVPVKEMLIYSFSLEEEISIGD